MNVTTPPGPGSDAGDGGTGAAGDESAPLARVAGHGLLWMMLSGTGIRVLSLVSQVVLGLLLSEGDFGVYAIAISLAFMARVLRDGGVRLLVVQEGRSRFPDNIVPAFWITAAFSGISALALSVAAPFAADVYGQAQLAPVLWVIALSLLLEPFILAGRSWLEVNMRFGPLARILAIGHLITYSLTVALAVLGLGPLSFVWPLVATGLWKAVVLSRYLPETPWRRRPRSGPIRAMLRRSGWVIVGSFVTRGPIQLDYMALGLVVPTALVGVYYFAYQLTYQLATLVATAVHRVLMPAFSTMVDQPGRLAAAVGRAGRGLAFTSVPLLFVLVPTIAGIEQVLWRGRWADAVAAAQVFSLLLPAVMVTLLPETVMQSLGRFRLWSGVMFIRAVGVPVVALAVGEATADMSDAGARVAVITAVIGGFLVLSGVIAAVFASWLTGVRHSNLISATAWPYAVGFAALGITELVVWLSSPSPLVRAVLGGVVFSVAYVLLGRLFLRSWIAELLAVTPDRLARPVGRLLRLPVPAASSAAEQPFTDGTDPQQRPGSGGPQ